MSKLEFTIDPGVFKTLITIQNKLPDRASGGTKAGALPAYDHPAGLALLGAKDGKLDTVVNLAMSGGCWDAPNISFKDFDVGFQEMIKEDRIVTGMALIRHPDWEGDSYGDQSYHKRDAKIPVHLKSQIHTMRNSFADITKTLWMVLQNDYFRLYRPTKDDDGRVKVTEISPKSMFDDAGKDAKIVKDKISNDIKRRAATKKAREEKKIREEAQRKKWEEEEAAELKREEARQKKAKAKADQVGLDLAEGKKSVIYAGNGLSYILGKDGKYILWQTGR
jgi:hypothetical protein